MRLNKTTNGTGSAPRDAHCKEVQWGGGEADWLHHNEGIFILDLVGRKWTQEDGQGRPRLSADLGTELSA